MAAVEQPVAVAGQAAAVAQELALFVEMVVAAVGPEAAVVALVVAVVELLAAVAIVVYVWRSDRTWPKLVCVVINWKRSVATER